MYNSRPITITLSVIAGFTLLVVGSGTKLALELTASEATQGPTASQFVGGGAWESQRDTVGKRGWQVELKRRDDNSLTGRITVVGSPALQQARIEAQVSGSDIDGVLVDDSDHQIGTFTGTVLEQGSSGTYTFKNGDTGNWSWDEPLPDVPVASTGDQTADER